MSEPPPCARCGERHASFGIGPPLADAMSWFCATCIQFQPASQATLAEAARDAIDD